jgi:HK97 family phage prohead protease
LDPVTAPAVGAPRRAYTTLRDIQQTGENAYSVTIYAAENVRSPLDLVLDGMSTVNYSKNPVVLWAHERSSIPIGRTLKIAKDGSTLRADFEFLEGDDFAGRVKNAWDRDFLRAASVGWWPIKSEPTEMGWVDLESDLLEWSIVPIPADPDALREAHARVISSLIEPPAPPAPGVVFLPAESTLTEAVNRSRNILKRLRGE